MKAASEVIDDALREQPDSGERWSHVVSLHRRNDEDAFRAAAALLDSPDPVRRELAADILAQLGAGDDERPFASPAVELLIDAIERETELSVLQAMATAFSHLSRRTMHPSAAPPAHAPQRGRSLWRRHRAATPRRRPGS